MEKCQKGKRLKGKECGTASSCNLGTSAPKHSARPAKCGPDCRPGRHVSAPHPEETARPSGQGARPAAGAILKPSAAPGEERQKIRPQPCSPAARQPGPDSSARSGPQRPGAQQMPAFAQLEPGQTVQSSFFSSLSSGTWISVKLSSPLNSMFLVVMMTTPCTTETLLM